MPRPSSSAAKAATSAALAQHLTGDTPAAIETEKKALSLLPPDAPGRGDYETALARFEAALKEPDTKEQPGGG